MIDVDLPASIKQTTAHVGDPPPSDPDVTHQINASLAALKPGQRLVFPDKAKYRTEGTLYWPDGRDAEVVGRGSRCLRFMHRDLPVLPDPWLGRGDATGAEHMIVGNGEAVAVRNLTFYGPNLPPEGQTWPAYVPDLEFQSGLLVWGGSDVSLVGARFRYMHGDGVRLSGGVDGVKLARTRIEQVGRQGLTLDGATDVRWLASGGLGSDSVIWGCARSVIDIEPGGNHEIESYGTVRHVEIAGLHIGYSMGHVLAGGGGGPNVGDIFVHHLFCHGMPLRIGVAAVPQPAWGKRPGYVFDRGPVRVEDNRSDVLYGSPVAFSYNRKLERLDWHRNYQRVATTQSRLAVYAEGCKVVDVRDNQFPGAREEVTVR